MLHSAYGGTRKKLKISPNTSGGRKVLTDAMPPVVEDVVIVDGEMVTVVVRVESIANVIMDLFEACTTG